MTLVVVRGQWSLYRVHVVGLIVASAAGRLPSGATGEGMWSGGSSRVREEAWRSVMVLVVLVVVVPRSSELW